APRASLYPRRCGARAAHGAGRRRRPAPRRLCARARASPPARTRPSPAATPPRPARARALRAAEVETRTGLCPRMAENQDVDPLAARTLELVNIPSESRNEERAIEYVRAAMPRVAAYDADTVLFYPGRIVLAGHYDTVPAQDNLPGRIEDGWVHGLGATDM